MPWVRVVPLVLFLAAAPGGVALADESCGDLARRARSECDQGRDATDRDVREAHWQRGKALAERAIQLDDNDANAHFALFCNQGELMRIDGESITSVFEFRRLMKELDRALELDPNNLDALSSKGTLLVRLPRLMGGDTKRGEALLREVVDRDPKAFNARLALCRSLEERGDRAEAVAFATRALEIAKEQGRSDRVDQARAELAKLGATH